MKEGEKTQTTTQLVRRKIYKKKNKQEQVTQKMLYFHWNTK